MSKLWEVGWRLSQRGQGMVEYALILALVAIVVAGVLGGLAVAISGKFNTIANSLNGTGG